MKNYLIQLKNAHKTLSDIFKYLADCGYGAMTYIHILIFVYIFRNKEKERITMIQFFFSSFSRKTFNYGRFIKTNRDITPCFIIPKIKVGI